MELQILKKKKLIGVVYQDAGGRPAVRDNEPELERLIARLLVTGVPQRIEVVENEKRMVTERFLPVTDEHFMLVLKEYLQRKGFIVKQNYPELIERAASLLRNYPEDPAKEDMIKKLPTMSMLELTYLIRELSNDAS